jgi:hypothetical protein
MRKRRKNKKLIIIITALLLLINIGYAAISSNLSINALLNMNHISWNIYFTNLQVLDGSSNSKTPAKIVDKTSISYDVDLEKPGNYYAFTVDVVNDGTLDAVIDKDGIVKTKLSDFEDTYVNYDVTYADGSQIQENDILNAGETQKLLIKVEYDAKITAEQINNLNNDLMLTLSFSINYVPN